MNENFLLSNILRYYNQNKIHNLVYKLKLWIYLLTDFLSLPFFFITLFSYSISISFACKRRENRFSRRFSATDFRAMRPSYAILQPFSRAKFRRAASRAFCAPCLRNSGIVLAPPNSPTSSQINKVPVAIGNISISAINDDALLLFALTLQRSSPKLSNSGISALQPSRQFSQKYQSRLRR